MSSIKPLSPKIGGVRFRRIEVTAAAIVVNDVLVPKLFFLILIPYNLSGTLNATAKRITYIYTRVIVIDSTMVKKIYLKYQILMKTYSAVYFRGSDCLEKLIQTNCCEKTILNIKYIWKIWKKIVTLIFLRDTSKETNFYTKYLFVLHEKYFSELYCSSCSETKCLFKKIIKSEEVN